MKHLRLALTLLALAPGALWADTNPDADQEQQQKPPTEIPDFSNLDEYVYVPKSTATFGYRIISGVKAKFSGSAMIAAQEALPPQFGANLNRTYHDGNVSEDTRSVITENGDGTAVNGPITPDGKTNTWTYTDSSQVTTDGFLQFHLYSAQTQDTEFNASGKTNIGMEVSAVHDLKDYGKHWSLKAFGGMSINDISAASISTVNAQMTTITDTYDLFGVTPPSVTPGAPYSSSSAASTTQNILDANGNPVLDSSGNPETETVDTEVLLGNSPLGRQTTTSAVTVLNYYKVHGAYATFRGGPQLIYNLTPHIHVAVSVGPALIYAGSTFTVIEALTPPTGFPVVDALDDTTSKFLLGYYVDATMQYDLTDTAGFYVGAYDQSAGSYKQSTNTPGGTYSTNVDFGNLTGLRAGLDVKF
jgi:hypothetical protein